MKKVMVFTVVVSMLFLGAPAPTDAGVVAGSEASGLGMRLGMNALLPWRVVIKAFQYVIGMHLWSVCGNS